MRAVEEPAELLVMEASTRGTLVHEVLQQFFREARAEGRPGPGEPWEERDRVRLLALLDEALSDADRRGVTGLPIFQAHERASLRADLSK